jgi:alkyldihydroxyacetonephosphate synthase
MHWSRWGDPGRATALPPSAAALVEAVFGTSPGMPTPSIDELRLPDARLPEAASQALAAAVGTAHVSEAREARIRHTRGKSTPDLLRMRAGDAEDAPDAVVEPGSHDEVLAALGACEEHGIAVVPFGGGTSVVGGVSARREGWRGVVALDLHRLDRLVSLDATSRTATLGAGLTGPAAEALLREHGLTLGHYPQSFEYATIGGFAATRSSGQASAGYGRFDAMVQGLRVATPRGTLALGRAPASAAGPDLRQLVLGSEGAFGVITEVTVRVRPVPARCVYETWRVESFAAGTAVLRALAQGGGELPTVLRLSDEAETALNLASPDSIGAQASDGCTVVVGYEGSEDRVAALREATAARLAGLGARPEGEKGGQAWDRGRFRAPYLRDSLLDEGVFVETLETAAFWSRIEEVYAGVRAALSAHLGEGGASVVVLCHISHVYETGASLYFTVAARPGDDPLGRWRAAKAAATDAVVERGGTITHHHAVGRDHREWLSSEVGDLGVEVLRAVKARLDPAGILNPGVLIPGSPDTVDQGDGTTA